MTWCWFLLTPGRVWGMVMSMLAQQRHEIILETIRRDGSVRVRDLVDLLGVSDMTIRRDLDLLEAGGHLAKVHGGATRTSLLAAEEPGFEAKLTRQEAQKSGIAHLAAGMVEPGLAIGLTAGTTTWKLATELLSVPQLTVVTNSPSVAQVFYRSNDRSNDHGVITILTGGIRTPSDALVGPLATASLASLQLDIVFMGVHGMDPEHGYSTPNLAEAETNRAFVHAARRLVVVADHTKWKTPGLATITSLEDADRLVSDSRLPADAVEHLVGLGVDVVLADPSTGSLPQSVAL